MDGWMGGLMLGFHTHLSDVWLDVFLCGGSVVLLLLGF